MKSAISQRNELSLDAELQSVVQGNNHFAWNLYAQLGGEMAGNLFFSPWSIFSALAMTYSGAKGGTAAEMANVLGFALPQESLHPAIAALGTRLTADARQNEIELNVANRLWLQQGVVLLKEYLDQLAQHYGAQVEQLDFDSRPERARQHINEWVAAQTEQKIRKLLEPDDIQALTTLILTNAVYFKAGWASQFEVADTAGAPFYVTPEEQVEIPFMRQVEHFGYHADSNVQIVELPYIGESFSMLLILPQEGKTLTDIHRQLTAENVQKWSSQLIVQQLEVLVPRFKVTQRFKLKQTLESLGMSRAFTPNADFSGIEPERLLYIGSVIHQAFVDVDEEGTEAAAATAVTMVARGRPLPPPIFRADRPFVFLIQDREDGNVLFLGKVSDPSSQ